MNKTLPLTLIALALVAVAATPTASACQYIGAGADQVNYLTCDSPAVGFLLDQVIEIVNFVVEYVTGFPLP